MAQPLSDRDREIAAIVGPQLRERGLLFVGLDVIGDYLTEINITSPTCIREIDNAFDTRIGERLMDAIAAKLQANQLTALSSELATASSKPADCAALRADPTRDERRYPPSCA